ncbi:MAG: class II aldolase/adducin family protein [Actinobacteria bacterium]|nr:class II aldolase/adducin family protein [Actinomycetota bacterium]
MDKEDKIICLPEEEILKPRDIILELSQLMLQRGLTDMSGGNIALRIGSKVYMTRRYSGERFRWKLRPDDIVLTDLYGKPLEGNETRISREAKLHYMILQEFNQVNCSIHAHPLYTLLIADLNIKPEAVFYPAEEFKLQEVDIINPEVKTMTDEEYNIVIENFRKYQETGKARIMIMPGHGVITAGRDHSEAFSLLDVLEMNSRFLFYREMGKTSKVFKSILDNVHRSDGHKISENISVDSTGRTGSYPQGGAGMKAGRNVITAEDILNLPDGITSISVRKDTLVTDQAEIIAQEHKVKIIRLE